MNLVNSRRRAVARYGPSWALILAVCCFTVVCPSCRNGRARTYPVSGSIRFTDHQPVRFGLVEFRCAQNGVVARGKLDAEGDFTLGTYKSGDGVPAGKYSAIVVQYVHVPDADESGREHPGVELDHHPSSMVDLKYSSYGTSGLTAEVKPEPTNRFEFVVTRLTPKSSRSEDGLR